MGIIGIVSTIIPIIPIIPMIPLLLTRGFVHVRSARPAARARVGPHASARRALLIALHRVPALVEECGVCHRKGREVEMTELVTGFEG